MLLCSNATSHVVSDCYLHSVFVRLWADNLLDFGIRKCHQRLREFRHRRVCGIGFDCHGWRVVFNINDSIHARRSNNEWRGISNNEWRGIREHV